MQVSTRAIVISKIRYKDHDLIVKCYTREFGAKLYLLKNVLKTKKGKIKAAYFQLFSILEIDAIHKDSRSFQYLKDVKLYVNLDALYTNVAKTTIVMFLSEILSSILKEEEKYTELYDFIETSIIGLNTNNNFSNFHIIFLTELTKYLGFYPDQSAIHAPYFNLQEGKFEFNKHGAYSISGENLTSLKQLLGTKFAVDKKLQFNQDQKQDVLNIILLYFKLHLGGFKEPRSLAVLNQVFK